MPMLTGMWYFADVANLKVQIQLNGVTEEVLGNYLALASTDIFPADSEKESKIRFWEAIIAFFVFYAS